MCGIAGILGPSSSTEAVGLMVDALSRRGPDDRGTWSDQAGQVVLGHTRLSIIDLSPLGHQPMSTVSGRFWISFNGEIYNYRELRRELEDSGATFASQTDTEVILAGFERWGHGCLQRLRGMFAFALWDKKERCLYLARDRLGIKPLLWAELPGGLIFASEIKAILASKMIEPVIEMQALFEVLANGAVSQPTTILRGVRALEPGTYLIVKANGTRLEVRYWDLAQASCNMRPTLSKLSHLDAVLLIREKLEEACRYHLIADVPVGSFLSGGIDSTAVTALMSRNMSERVKSFSLGFETTPEVDNELPAARLAAEHIGCEHHEIVLTGREVSENFDDLIQTIDQPSHDGTNTYFVSRAASQVVKVTLSGLGGDELFAGYSHFSLMQKANSSPRMFFDAVLSCLHQLRPNRWTLLAATRQSGLAQRYAKLRRILSDRQIFSALDQSARTSFKHGFAENYVRSWIDASLDSITQTSIIEYHSYLRNTLLRDADVMSMGNALEVRPILLDHVLVEHALALNHQSKIRNGRLKAVFADAVRDLLPQRILDRPKTGFEMPLGTWLRTVLRDRILAALEDPWTRTVFSRQFLQDRRRRLNDPRDTRLLWTLLIFISWARQNRCTLSS